MARVTSEKIRQFVLKVDDEPELDYVPDTIMLYDIDGNPVELIGPEGPQGEAGIGNSWYTGAGAPDNGAHEEGDFYLRTSNGDVYQKTAPATWTIVANIIGPTGATGPEGDEGPQGDTGATGASTVWRSGTGAPAGGLGVIGDWYLNDANGDVYEKTGASTWTLRDNITGPTGAAGADGDDGAPGSGGWPRDTILYTTASLADDASETDELDMGTDISAKLFKIVTDVAARVRVYATNAQRDADAARAIGVDPTGDHGLLFEFVTTADLSWTLSPAVDIVSDAADGVYGLIITNLSGSTDTVAVTLHYIRTE